MGRSDIRCFYLSWAGQIGDKVAYIRENQPISILLDTGSPSGEPIKYTLYRTFFRKGRFIFGASVLCLSLAFAFPSEAHAGFFSGIWKLLSGSAPETSDQPSLSAVSIPLLGAGQSGSGQPLAIGGPDDSISSPISSTGDSALVAPRNPAGTLPSIQQDRIFTYIVSPGDTPGSIADKFGISLSTLLWANNIRNSNLIKVGDELIILPVSGVRYEVKKGDTIESIAKKFKGDAGEILGFNGLAIGEDPEVGSVVIIPDGELAPSISPSPQPSRFAGLPEYRGYYMRPIIGGRKSRGIHGFNGIDLANSCGLPVFASAEGIVIIGRSSGWNGGYGRYIVISHPNSTQTLYAHLTSLLASVGQTVPQGALIGTIGSTGNSTGCHAHFEVRGAKNPF